MRLSFRARLTMRWLAGFGLVLTLALAAVYVGIRGFLVRDLDAQLRTLAGTELASAADEPGLGLHLHEFPVDAAGGGEYAGKFVQLIDSRGTVMMQSPVLGATPALLQGADMRSALAGRSPVVDVRVNGRGGRMTALATAGSEKYLVAVGLFTDKLEATLAQLYLLLSGVWLGSIGLTAALGLTLASSALDPIHRITRQASSIAQGQFASRLDEPKLDDEIGQMTHLLNEMLDRLHGAIEANRRFAADASHELRGPLTAMLGELDVTLKRERAGSEYRETLARLRERLVDVSALTEDLMLLVRAQEGRAVAVSEVSVADLLNGVAARAATQAAAAHVAMRVTAPSTLVAYADGRLLDRVVDNLVRNGLQHSPEGGTLTLSAERVDAGARSDWVADEVMIRVSDDGPGIPAAERERVFERFYRLDPSRSRRTGGAGLGLAISREIVHLFRGRIRVADTDGIGTTLEVRIPGGVRT
jgi:two-component system OmpR family sensor kinase